jgi:phage terminase small subunit
MIASLNTSGSKMQFPIEQFTAKQQKFIIAYCRLQHVTNAAIEAGVNPKTAGVQGSKWLANPRIKAEVDRRLRLRLDRYDVAPDKIIREMALLAFSSLDDFIAFTQDNQAIIDFEGVTRDQMAGLTELVSEELRSRDGSTAGVRTKIRLADKRAALMDLAKLINMLQPDRVEHSGPNGQPIQHAHAHVVLNPRDMTPKQRAQLKAVLLSIERGQDDEDDDDGGDGQAG